MVFSSLVRKTFRADRRALVGWCAAVAAAIAVYVPWYPLLSEGTDMREFIEEFVNATPDGLVAAMGWADLATGAGYLNATVYSLYLPAIMIACAAMLGARTVAGPEESGRLDLYLANPISRRRFLLERFAVVAAQIVVIGAIAWLMVLIFDAALGLGVSYGNVTAASVALVMFGLSFAAIAVAAGAATGKRAAVLTVTVGLAAATYLLRALSGQFDAIRSIRWLSPFDHYLGGQPLLTGLDLGGLLVLAGITVVALGIALATFDRRDLGV